MNLHYPPLTQWIPMYLCTTIVLLANLHAVVAAYQNARRENLV